MLDEFAGNALSAPSIAVVEPEAVDDTNRQLNDFKNAPPPKVAVKFY
jgi:hypothetical protein